MSSKIRKKLSANDVGATKAHQAGILVPKDENVLSFFPQLDGTEKNPRMTLVMYERSNRARWEFNFIYYNNRLFGGTRNEYRLTCMTGFLKAIDAKVDDELIFSRDENASFEVDILRANRASSYKMDGDTLVLGGGWTVVSSVK
jgi:Restriction endonuclease EcoRII, N-terminal